MKPNTSNSPLKDTLSQLKSSISFPLLSKIGKAQKLPIPRKPPIPSYSPILDESQAFQMAEEELRKLSEAKKIQLKHKKNLPPSSCFRSVSRSSNVTSNKISPLSISPPPTRYNPNFDFLNPKVKGFIAYHSRSRNSPSKRSKPPTPRNLLMHVGGSLKTFTTSRTFTPSPQKS